MAIAKTETTQQFKVHPAILHSIITAQAGTIAKAFLELTMNSIDANATYIRIDTNGSTFKVSDDGRGFSGKEEIESFFGTFGTPHKEGDATYGKYRMGRGQLFAFAKNSWRTDTFKMSVDIKENGLEYILEENLEKVVGCTIVGSFYEKMKSFELEAMLRQFSEFVLYAQIPVYLNGDLISKNPKEEKWDIETEEAYIKKKVNGNLAVYNLGVLIKHVSGYEYGCGGVIVSKQQIAVNFARNDILTSQCKVWKKISQYLNNEVKETVKKEKLSEEEKSSISRRFTHSEMDYFDCRELPLITDCGGRHFSIAKLAKEKNLTISHQKGSTLADMVNQRKLARVIDPITLERFGVNSLKELIEKIRAVAKNSYETIYNYRNANKKVDYKKIGKIHGDIDGLSRMTVFEDIGVFNSHFNDGYATLEENELSKVEKCALKAIRTAEDSIRRTISAILDKGDTNEEMIGKRTIHIGKSEMAHAWTDGRTMITINQNLIKNAKYGFDAFVPIVNILVHEYLHNSSTMGSHTHDDLFFELYHDVTTYSRLFHPQRFCYYDIAMITKNMARNFLSNCKASKIALSKNYFDDLDLGDTVVVDSLIKEGMADVGYEENERLAACHAK